VLGIVSKCTNNNNNNLFFVIAGVVIVIVAGRLRTAANVSASITVCPSVSLLV
jgi:hypothetical protein